MLFKQLDKDNSGTVDSMELLAALGEFDSRINLKDVKQFIKENDANNDGCLDKTELRAFFKSLLG